MVIERRNIMSWLQPKEYEKIELDANYDESKKSITKMFEIQEKILNSENNNIQIDATRCGFIGSTCLSILSSLFLISKDKNINIKFTKESRLLNKLIENRIHKYKLQFNC